MDDAGAYVRIILLPKTTKLGNTGGPIVVNRSVYPQPQQNLTNHTPSATNTPLIRVTLAVY